MKVIIVGGVAAGASAAARLRRLNEEVEIVLLERGAYISYANCGLPYHLSKVIPERGSLLVMSAAAFSERFNIDVRTESEVIKLDPVSKTVSVRHNNEIYTEKYDKLLLATGSSPVMMDLPGTDTDKVMQLWTIPDMNKVIAKLDAGARKVVVVGAGFIGLEVAENLRERGMEVTVVELAPQVLPTIDAEMSSYLIQELYNAGIDLKLGRKVIGFERSPDYCAVLDSGEKLSADLVMMCVGVKPNSELAREAGLTLGSRGHIVVSPSLQTSDADIYAAGDVIEVNDPVTGTPTAIPLAGPANKQGRIVADNIAGGNSTYSGSLGAAVIKVGTLTAASVGLTERRLKQLNLPYHKIYTHPGSHASYYPGSAILHLKLLFAPDGRIFGAQAVGAKGADKRIDVIATTMQCGKNVHDLAQLELSYAPPYNSAKDPVNFLGMVAENILAGYSDVVYADALPAGALLIDVREEEEFLCGTIPGAINIPSGQLRSQLEELPKNRKIVVCCRVGFRAYAAERVLKQHGFDCANLSGGFFTYQAFHQKPVPVVNNQNPTPCDISPDGDRRTLDVRSLSCPGPVVRLKKEIDTMADGAELLVRAQGSFAPDLNNWLKSGGHELVGMDVKNGELEAVIRKRSGSAAASASAPSVAKSNSAAIILFSNDLDKALAALIVACGMAAAGNKTSIFFTFWGLSVLRKNPAPMVKKSLISRMFGFMLPNGARKLALSKMNMAGMGTMMMKQVMKREQVPTLEELLQQAKELGVEFIACEMAMNVMGLQREELIGVDEVAGVASFAEIASNAGTTLFI